MLYGIWLVLNSCTFYNIVVNVDKIIHNVVFRVDARCSDEGKVLLIA